MTEKATEDGHSRRRNDADAGIQGKSGGSAPALRQVGGAVRTLAILEYVVAAERPVSAAEIARATQLNPSTAFNLTRTLADGGYLLIVRGTRRYAVGPRLQALGQRLVEKPRAEDLLRPPLLVVATQFQVVVSLWRRVSRYSMMLVLSAEHDAATRIQVTTGVKMPLLHGSMGRIMATSAGLEDVERRQLFDVVNFERPISYRSFMAQAKQVAQRGWSMDDGHVRQAVASVSVPVPDGAESVRNIVVATMFRGQHRGASLEALVGTLMEAAARIAPVCANELNATQPIG